MEHTGLSQRRVATSRRATLARDEGSMGVSGSAALAARIAFAAIAATILAPAAAPAATVAVRTSIEGGFKGPEVTVFHLDYSAEPGERNGPTVSREADGRIAVADATAPLTPGAGCIAADGRVTCSGGLSTATFRLGDGDDRLVAVGDIGLGIDVQAGTGDDAVTATARADRLDGGGGRDDLDAGAGDDSLADGDAPGTADSDVLRGADGSDSVSYGSRTAAMAVDLLLGTAGEAGEADVLAGVESIATGSGDDTIRGSAGAESLQAGDGANVVDGGGGDDSLSGSGRLAGGPGDDDLACGEPCTADGGDGDDELMGSVGGERLSGGGGDDVLFGLDGGDTLDGGAGDDQLRGDFAVGEDEGGDDVLDGGPGRDTLFGGPGRDRLAGGPGRDRIVSRDGRADRVDCGAARDEAIADRRDRPAGCERTTRTIVATVSGAVTSVLDADASVSVDVGCPAVAATDCRGRVTFADARGRRIGSDAWDASAGGNGIALATLRGRLARSARRGRSIPIRAAVTIRDVAGAGTTLRRRLVARPEG